MRRRKTKYRTSHAPEVIDLSIGLWWRFSSYEMVNGFIRPEPRAKLERYNPWSEYGPGHVSPYQSLINLIENLPVSSDGTVVKLRKENEKQLLDWCSKYGLLGLLP